MTTTEPTDPLRPAAESVAAWLESRATHYRELGLAPVASELDRQAGVLRAALAEGAADADRYEVLESPSRDGDNPSGPGRVIAENQTRADAEAMLARLYAPNRCWTMRKQHGGAAPQPIIPPGVGGIEIDLSGVDDAE